MSRFSHSHEDDWGLLPPVSRQVQDVILEEAAPGLRILEICLAPAAGVDWIGEQVRRLVQGLQARGHFVQIVHPHQLPRGLARWTRWPANRASLANYDILHIHAGLLTPRDAVELLGLGCVLPALRSRIVLSFYRALTDVWDERRIRRLKNLALVLTHTSAEYSSLRPHLPAETLALVPWGVELERFPFPPPDSDVLHVLFLGLCSADSMEGLADILRETENVMGHVLLSANEQPPSEPGPAVPNLQCHYIAGVDEIREHLRQSQVLCWPANDEAACGISFLALEALAAGCLLVAPDSSSAVRELAQQVGFIYPAGQPQALRQLLENLRDNPGLRRRYQELGRRKAELVPWDDTLDTLEQALARVHLRRLISFALRRVRSPEDLYSTLLRQMVNMVGADGGSFFLSHQDGSLTLQAVYGRGPSPPRRAARFEGVYGFVADQRQILLLPADTQDTYLEESWPVSDLRRSAVIVPVQHHGRLLGVAEAIRGFARRPFDESHRRWFGWWADAAGEAITAVLARLR